MSRPSDRTRFRATLGVMGAFVLAVSASVGCCEPWRHGYEGAGVFADRGWRQGSERYELRLGTLVPTSARPTSGRFEVGRLPEHLMFGLRFRLDNDERSSDLRALNVRIRIVEGSTGQVVLDYDGPLDPVRRAPVTFSSWRESADVTVLTAKFEASIPKREPLSVMVEFPPARGWQPRRPVEIVLVGGGWQ